MVDDRTKWLEYAVADLLIRPSVSENFDINIDEGLYAWLPVICTKGTPWEDVERFGCGLWIDVGAAPLASALVRLFNLSPPQLRDMGENGYSLIEQKYTWSASAQQLICGYKEVLHG